MSETHIHCPHCGKAITIQNYNLNYCPYCGTQLTQTASAIIRKQTPQRSYTKPNSSHQTILFVIGILFLFSIIGSMPYWYQSPSSPVPTTSTPISYPRFDAVEICMDYGTNQVAADTKYLDKKIIVDGMIDRIGVDTNGNPYLSLYTAKYVLGLKCTFSKSDNDKISGLNPTEEVVVLGTCSGKNIYGIINISDCTFTK